jgi:hypothetical protein
MRSRPGHAVCLAASTAVLLGGGVASASQSSPSNWATPHEAVVCGVAAGIEGTAPDPGTGAMLNGLWPGLQCQTTGIHDVPLRPGTQAEVGDPAVQLGQGRSGRARLLDISQDDLESDARYVVMGAGSVWSQDGITCTLAAESVRCANTAGYGFTMSPGKVNLFSPAGASTRRRCGSVSYTFPHTDDHGHAALNNLTAVDVSCATARSVARALIVTGRAPKHWHAAMKSSGEEVLTDGRARVTGDIAN